GAMLLAPAVILIPSRLRPALPFWRPVLPLFQRYHCAVKDCFGRSFRRDRNQEAFATIKLRKRNCALFVNPHSHPNGFRAVVFALDECRTANITNTADFRRTTLDVIYGFAHWTCAASTEARDNLFDWHFVIQHGVQRNFEAR